MIQIDCFALGDFETNCYILRASADARRCVIVDPGFSPEPVRDFIQQQGLEPGRVLLTHGHCDHIAGLKPLRKIFPNLPVGIGAGDAPMLTSDRKNLSLLMGSSLHLSAAEELFHGGETVTFDDLTFEVLPTPGHTPGGVSYYCAQEAVIFSGDLIFAGSIGRCDFPGGDQDVLLDSIRRQLFRLDDKTVIYTGHGPATTVGCEKRTNPYLQ
jgi:hydroxyacylglutathione hydrolase